MAPPEHSSPALEIEGQVADAVPGNWVDHLAPAGARPYLRLARADRPIGSWLLMWPCWWAAALAAVAAGNAYPDPWHLALFFVGAFAMRGAGCAYNDIVDRDYDAAVARTRSRPIPSGQITAGEAKAFMIALALIGFVVLIQFNWYTVGLGIASLAIVAVYPFMKRITNWPQAVLGLAFGWGALMGWAAVFGSLGAPALVLYSATIAWIVGYDTIYAHQDKEDDALVGLGSTALRFGPATKRWLSLFYGLAWIGFLAAGLMVGARLFHITALGLVALHMTWQITTLDTCDPANCLKRFKSNHHLGGILFAGLALEALFGSLQ